MEIISLGKGIPDIKIIYINQYQAFMVTNYKFILLDIEVINQFKHHI